ncbi:hypothetical protein ACOMHN_030248 [Nucella lapillus]
MELGILHNSPPSTKRGCRAGRLHRLWHGLPPAPWPCTQSQHHSVPSRNLHPLMVPPFLQPHPDLQSAVGNAPLSSKHAAQLPTTDCLLSIISPMGGQPSDAPALSPPSPLQQGGQSSNAPALSPPSPLPQGGQPIALALSPPSPPPQGGQPSDAPGLSPSSSTLLLCPSDSTLNICHLNSQSAVKTAPPHRYLFLSRVSHQGGSGSADQSHSEGGRLLSDRHQGSNTSDVTITAVDCAMKLPFFCAPDPHRKPVIPPDLDHTDFCSSLLYIPHTRPSSTPPPLHPLSSSPLPPLATPVEGSSSTVRTIRQTSVGPSTHTDTTSTAMNATGMSQHKVSSVTPTGHKKTNDVYVSSHTSEQSTARTTLDSRPTSSCDPEVYVNHLETPKDFISSVCECTQCI